MPDDTDSFLLAHLNPGTTGLPCTVWISGRGEVRSAVELNAADAELLARWVELNREVLYLYWTQEIDTAELVAGLRRLT